MNETNYQRYLETSIYTDVGYYQDFIASLPDDIHAIGRLVCDQITHPSMFFTEPSSYLQDTYYGKFSAIQNSVSKMKMNCILPLSR